MDLNTYLFFDGQCEEAFRLYEKVLGGKLAGLMRYAEAPSVPRLSKAATGSFM
jgi:PhnB protein